MLDSPSFVRGVVEAVPEAAEIVSAHLADNDGELLLHLLVSDFLRFTVDAFSRGEVDVAKRIVDAVSRGLSEGDEYVQNAVAVSFVEDFGASDGETDDLLALWPPALRAELGR